jgi:hypothetical protein
MYWALVRTGAGDLTRFFDTIVFGLKNAMDPSKKVVTPPRFEFENLKFTDEALV